MSKANCKALIIGAGLAGMSLALRLAESGRSVSIVAKGPLTESSSHWAQGGIAAAIGPGDTIKAHAEDTLEAGAGLCNREAVDYVVERGPECIRWLVDHGVVFTRAEKSDEAALHLTREGGHSERRVVHADTQERQRDLAGLAAVLQRPAPPLFERAARAAAGATCRRRSAMRSASRATSTQPRG